MGPAALTDQYMKIGCLSLLNKVPQSGIPLVVGSSTFYWDNIPAEPDLDGLAAQIHRLRSEYDALALDGVALRYQVGGRMLEHNAVTVRLGVEQVGWVADGSTVQPIVERYLVNQAAHELAAEIREKRILLLCGLNRYGSAEVLKDFSRELTFGDLLYGFRLGIPIKGYNAYLNTVQQLAKTVSQLPADWFWPATRRRSRLMPRFQHVMRWADVIVGGLSYFERYMPDNLSQKIVFTTVRRREDYEQFAAKGVACVISLTPFIHERYVPVQVLEAACSLDARSCGAECNEDYLLARLQELALKPRIRWFSASDDDEEFALLETPRRPIRLKEPEVAQVEELPKDESTGKFCFVIHPLVFEQIRRFSIVRKLNRLLPQRLLEDAMVQVRPWPVGRLKNVVSSTGARAEGILYAIPMTSKTIMRYPPKVLYKRLLQVAHDAQARGCRIMGLGAYTSVAGDAGVTVSRESPIGVTTGNSYTVAATLLTAERAAYACGIDVDDMALMVVGATGSIGSICARMVAPRVRELYLVSPRPEKLLALASEIEQEHPRLKGCIHLSRSTREFLPKVDGIIATTSATEPIIDVAELRPGCLVLDVARPPDIREQAARKRRDVLVIESGEILLPQDAELTVDIGLPRGLIYACLAETVLLALEKRFGHYTLGRQINPSQVNEIAEIAARHGFEMSAIRSFGRSVESRRFRTLAKINTPRFPRLRERQADLFAD